MGCAPPLMWNIAYTATPPPHISYTAPRISYTASHLSYTAPHVSYTAPMSVTQPPYRFLCSI